MMSSASRWKDQSAAIVNSRVKAFSTAADPGKTLFRIRVKIKCTRDFGLGAVSTDQNPGSVLVHVENPGIFGQWKMGIRVPSLKPADCLISIGAFLLFLDREGSGLLNFNTLSFCSPCRPPTSRGVWQRFTAPLKTCACSAVWGIGRNSCWPTTIEGLWIPLEEHPKA